MGISVHRAWHQLGTIEEERYEAEGTYLSGRVPAVLARQIAAYRV